MAQNPVFTIKLKNGKEMKGELYPPSLTRNRAAI